jgi:hypothetical protein
MTPDLDQLRAVLRERAALAPSTDELLPRTRVLVHRRQMRRRVGLVAGVVAVTALALVGAGMFGDLAHNRSAAQLTRPLPAPTLPFSVGSVPTGYWLNSWYLGDAYSEVQYFTGQSPQVLTIQEQGFDPAKSIQLTARTQTTVHGRPAVSATVQSDARQWLSWEAGPGNWILITEPQLATASLSAVADSVSLTPSTLPVPLHITSVPADLEVNYWLGVRQPTTDDVDVLLCPVDMPPSGAAKPNVCVQVHEGTGAAPKNPFQSNLPVISANSDPVTLTPRNLLPVTSDNGRVVTRQVDSTRWVAATSVSASPALILRLAMAAG